MPRGPGAKQVVLHPALVADETGHGTAGADSIDADLDPRALALDLDYLAALIQHHQRRRILARFLVNIDGAVLRIKPTNGGAAGDPPLDPRGSRRR